MTLKTFFIKDMQLSKKEIIYSTYSINAKKYMELNIITSKRETGEKMKQRTE